MANEKPPLYNSVLEAIVRSGWRYLFISDPSSHPLKIHIFRGQESYTLLVYIWNLTHGGGFRRPSNEYRIQATGITQFEKEPGSTHRTLILGWWQVDAVFAAFDYRKHTAVLGNSPSLQIGHEALERAHEDGIGLHRKKNGEIAVAVRPDYLVEYVRNQEALHSIRSEVEVEVLHSSLDDTNPITDETVERIPAPRRIVTRELTQKVRDYRFRQRILDAYEHQCAICRLQLELVEAAHIVPVYNDLSTDKTSNGIALCVLHHEAYDDALVTFDESYHIALNEPAIAALRNVGRHGGLDYFRSGLQHPSIHVPQRSQDRPDGVAIRHANHLRGWPDAPGAV